MWSHSASVAAGLPVPRAPVELQQDGYVRTEQGVDSSEAFARGAEMALAVCQREGVVCALLKERSLMRFSLDLRRAVSGPVTARRRGDHYPTAATWHPGLSRRAAPELVSFHDVATYELMGAEGHESPVFICASCRTFPSHTPISE